MSEAILPRPQGLNFPGVDVSLLLARRVSSHRKGTSDCCADISRERSDEEAQYLSGLRCVGIRRTPTQCKLSRTCQGRSGWHVRRHSLDHSHDTLLDTEGSEVDCAGWHKI
jgi:hypothetical protein